MSMFMAAAVVASVAFAGVSVDAIRGYLVQSRLSAALDAAGLAGARVMFSPTRDADIQMYFDSNFPPGYMGATVTGPTFTVDTAKEILTLSAQATIGTTLTQILGYDTFTVAATSEITRQTEMLDVVLAVDMSGSMDFSISGGGTRLAAAKTAALELVDILYGDDGLAPLLKIGLVPWSGKVNITNNGVAFDPGATQTVAVPNFTNPITGASQSSIYFANNSPVPLLSAPEAGEPFTDSNGNGKRDSGESYTDTNGNGQHDKAWKGCTFARYTDDSSNNDADMDVGPVVGVGGVDDWAAWETVGWQGRRNDSGPSCAMAGGGWCVPCLSQGITPLQTTKASITAAINGLSNPEGSTEMISGLAWAWRVLVPEAPFTEADANPAGQRTQAIILLTDGLYTGWYNDSYKQAFGNNHSARPDGPNRLKTLATKIKDSGVIIYTIQFAENSSSLGALLEDVASGPDTPFYNYAANGAELTGVFQEVANDLSQLRLSM
jgi:Flp pilus assembly protein TadG